MDVYSTPSFPEEPEPAAQPQAPAAQPAPAAIRYSVVVPFYNEAGIVQKFYARTARVMKRVAGTCEIILVNDGSTDETPRILERIAMSDPRVVFVDLRRNFGQAAALQAGFDQAGGEVIIAMDGDLQHDPYEIPLFIRKIDEGYDIASGWRVRRGDNLLMRRIPSRVANWLLAKVSGVPLHDFGTTFKAYRREVLDDVRLYGDMHRFVPAVCSRLGARVCEVPIKNVRRRSGKSNYGIARTFRVVLDLVTLRFITGYLTRPLHFFGKWGLGLGGAGMAILAYGLGRKIYSGWEFDLFVEHGPLMALGFMLVVAGMLMLATGLIGELLMRIYFESTGARTYAVRRVVRKDDAPSAP
ncbi:MAG: glycosyltransferase family 2 protein [Phycisphaerae bacterium]|nr:glycosyltransferase family 2 protein [Phycisphaerae bacterium]